MEFSVFFLLKQYALPTCGEDVFLRLIKDRHNQLHSTNSIKEQLFFL